MGSLPAVCRWGETAEAALMFKPGIKTATGMRVVRSVAAMDEGCEETQPRGRPKAHAQNETLLVL